jgi:GAF domain-containing protein
MNKTDFTPTTAQMPLPVRIRASFKAMFDYWEELAQSSDPARREPARLLLNRLAAYPELAQPFDDFSILSRRADEIRELFSPMFPEQLQTNEIKAITMPFTGHLANPTTRFKGILERAGEDFDWRLSQYDPDQFYIAACITVMNVFYGAGIEYKQSYYFDVPNTLTGISRRYRAFINADHATFKTNANTIPLTPEDTELLIENFHDIDLWKSKIPEGSYDIEGFALVSLFDVTEEEALSAMKNTLLAKHALQSDELRSEISRHMQAYINMGDVEVDFATYDEDTKKIQIMGEGDWSCGKVTSDGIMNSSECFCGVSHDEIFERKGMFVVPEISRFPSGQSVLVDRMRETGVESFIIAPLTYDDKVLGFLELSSSKPASLNSVVGSKLASILPMFTVAMQRALEERETQLEAIVQEKFTALHPSVSWRFFEVAEHTLANRNTGKPDTDEQVVFRDVIPLYGQFDIRGSSTARNAAIQNDLVKQLSLAEGVMDGARAFHKLPIYDHVRFRIQKYRRDLETGIHAGDEIKILDFLKSEIYPVFKHLSSLSPEIHQAVESYEARLDPDLHVIYEERKRYETTVTQLNELISGLVEAEQVKAQEMLPHYFEKYKTDGVEYNLYLGQSLQPNKPYDPIYLRNMRLWQLLLTSHIENRIKAIQDELPMKLEITSLILAHNSPLSIKFRQDEKKFDVDGAYNIRYEIMKKRIDKAFIKNTRDRLTQPGKISVVFSQDDEAQEYRQYFEYLHALDIVEGDVESLELEDLQGTSGLKALRVDLRYSEKPTTHLSEIYSVVSASE